MSNPQQKIVLVSGAPGVGKTTLAIPLAKALNFTLISKDDIKETLYEAMDGRPNNRPFSKKIGTASWEILWKLATRSPNVVLESNFRPNSPIEQAHLAKLHGQIIEVHCQCPVEEIIRRYNSRDKDGNRHYAHAMTEITAEQVAEFDGGMGHGTLIQVDTSQPVDIPTLAQKINSFWR